MCGPPAPSPLARPAPPAPPSPPTAARGRMDGPSSPDWSVPQLPTSTTYKHTIETGQWLNYPLMQAHQMHKFGFNKDDIVQIDQDCHFSKQYFGTKKCVKV